MEDFWIEGGGFSPLAPLPFPPPMIVNPTDNIPAIYIDGSDAN